MARLVAYQVQDDGNWDPVAFKKEDLKSGEVFILVVEERKELWIWIGQGAHVRTRFISSTVAQEIRRLYGLTLRVRSADQGSEPEDFWICVEDVPEEGLGPMDQSTVITSVIEQTQDVKAVNKDTKKRISKVKVSSREKSPSKISKRKTHTSKKLVQSQLFQKNSRTKIDTPLCPKCGKGNLLPYSEEIKGITIPIARWECSNCGYNPQA
ncbi:hypothetical protein [Candidatus Hodarchaeum mangrovi]